jgi:hypothetical protein
MAGESRLDERAWPASAPQPSGGPIESRPSPSSRHEQERWALMVIREVWPRRDLLRSRAPLLHVGDGEPQSKEHVEVGREGPVLLDHPFGQPICRTRAFI